MTEEKAHPAGLATRFAGLIGFVLVLLGATVLFFHPGEAAASGSVSEASLPESSVGEILLQQPSAANAASATGGEQPGTTGPTSYANVASPGEAGAYPPPEFSVADISVVEGDSGIVQAIFTIIRTGYLEVVSAINFSTSDGLAEQPADYAPKSGTLVFDRTVSSQTVTVDVNGDTLDELDENFFLDLSQPVLASISDAQAQGTIIDDDPLPEISIQDVTVTEGNTGSTAAIFSLALNAASGKTVTVEYSTADGSAMQPADYLPGSGTITFLPGDVAETLSINVVADLLDEDDETFSINLANPLNAVLPDSQAQGTISDDDQPPGISIQDVTVTEGDSGSTNAAFAVTLDAPSSKTITVDYVTLDGTATQPSDYLPASGTLTFLPGDTSEQLDIAVLGDITTENNEAFMVDLSNPVNASLADGQAQGNITDDDQLPEISIQDVTVVEGNSGLTVAQFNLHLSAATSKTISVDFATADGTALHPADFLADSGTITFTPGDITKILLIQVAGDTLDEPDEVFTVNLANPLNGTLADNQALGSITDDDLPPTLSIQDISVAEGDSGTSLAGFTVSLNAPSGKTVSVNYTTLNGSATQPLDYLPAAGTLTFVPGDTSESLQVSIVGDTLDEPDETFLVNLALPTNASFSDNQASATINDDDTPPSISISDQVVTEGNGGTTAAIFSVSLSAPSGRAINVNFATQNSTATQPADYQAASGTLFFAAGETSRTVQVNITGDLLDEFDETFLVNLSSATFASLQDGQAQGTINDDDLPPQLSIEDVTVVDGVTANVLATFIIQLDAPSGKPISVDYATQDGSATAPEDYMALTGTVTINPGQTQVSVLISVIGSVALEPEEYFYLNLSQAVNAWLADDQAIGTILETHLIFIPIVFRPDDTHWYHPP